MADVERFDGDMRREFAPRPALDRRIADLARRQHGVVARRQLLTLEIGLEAVDHRLRAGKLHLVHRGVYAVGRPGLSQHGRWMAALLALPDSVLSHQSAAALLGLRPDQGRAHVTVPRRHGHARPGIVIHCVRTLDPRDRTEEEGIPVTTVARTLLDLAEVLPFSQLHRTFEAAERLRILDMRSVAELIERSRGRHGLRPLRALVEHSRLPEPAARSELERRFLDLCDEAGLPRPAVNVLVAGFEVDALWPAERLVVELDGHEFHRTRPAFERDRARDAALVVAGYVVVRITYRRLLAEPARIADELRTLLLRGRN